MWHKVAFNESSPATVRAQATPSPVSTGRDAEDTQAPGGGGQTPTSTFHFIFLYFLNTIQGTHST